MESKSREEFYIKMEIGRLQRIQILKGAANVQPTAGLKG